MKKTQLFLRSIMASAMIAGFSVVAMGQATTVPVIDGDLSDAAWANAQTFPIQAVINNDNITDANDLSGTVKVLWSADSVYVALDIKDDVLFGEFTTDVYRNDNVCIYFDLNNQKTGSYIDGSQLYWEINWYDNGIGGRLGPDWKNPDATANIKKIVTEGTGYTLELASAWSVFGHTPTIGALIGFDIKLSDNDGAVESGSQRSQLALSDVTDGGWSNPSVFGVIKLNADGSTKNLTDLVIDGEILDKPWLKAEPFEIASVINNDNITDANDLSGTVKVLWTADSVYVALNIKDDVLFGEFTTDVYRNDNVCIYFDLNNQKTGSYVDGTQLYWEINWYDDGIGGRLGADWGNPDPTANIKKIVTEGVGYTLELSAAWSSFGFTPEVGSFIGFDVKLSDNDGVVESGSQRSQLAWNDNTDGGWNNPGVFGTIQLLEGGTVAAVINNPEIDGVFDPFWALAAPQSVNGVINNADIANAADLSANLRVRWDANNFYYFIEIKDDSLYGLDPAGYPNDNLCVYLDLYNKKTATYVDESQLYWEIYFHNDVIAGRDGADWRNPDTTANIVRVVTPGTGYVVEMAAAWDSIYSGFVPSVGDTLGFDTKISDNDGGTRMQIAFMDLTDGGWGNPSLFGAFKLLEGGYVEFIGGRPVASKITLKETDTDGIVEVKWTAVAGAANYEVLNGTKLIATTELLTVNDTVTETKKYTYTVKAFDADGNILNQSMKAIEVEVETAVNTASSVAFNIFPNPASDMVKITAANAITSVRLMDLSGRVISRVTANGNNAVVSLSNVKAGLYMVAVESNGTVATQKLIVK